MLREAIAYGADDAVLLTDKRFAGADTIATAEIFNEVGPTKHGKTVDHEEALDFLQTTGVRIGCVTNKASQFTLPLLKDLGVDKYFEIVICGDMVERKKPAPDVYLLALDRLGLDPVYCLALEDTEAGLASARAAGLTTVITVNGATRHQDFTGALLVVDQLGDPGKPMEVLAGDAGGAQLVDMALLRRLHREAQGG